MEKTFFAEALGRRIPIAYSTRLDRQWVIPVHSPPKSPNMLTTRTLLPILFFLSAFHNGALAQLADAASRARAELIKQGFLEQDLQDLVVKDDYGTKHNGMRHTILRQRWMGTEVWNGDIALHQASNGSLVKLNSGAWPQMAKRVNATAPGLTAEQAVGMVLGKEGLRIPTALGVDPDGLRMRFDGSAFRGEPVTAQLVYQPMKELLILAWNVNYYHPSTEHWWNVRIDALTGAELDRNDWVAQCAFDHAHVSSEACPTPEAPPAPIAPNDYRVYPWPLESPSHGAQTIRNAPWLDAGIASPYGWHDTDGAAGAEFTDTRGNNVQAQEDADANNTGGYRPSGGATLDFDFPVDLAQAPNAYRDAVITNLFYWNNLMHDIWYQYGFDEPSGNFQTNNYGRGGAGSDAVQADALDGSSTNNANFGTPSDGGAPRMQMFVWTSPNPDRTSDLDNGVVAHEYGHGISNRLVGGPSNTSCLSNAEQMGEGWSDFFGLVMTIEAGDQGTDPRGIGTYVLGQPVTGAGIRPAPYSTSFGVNNYTYASVNSTSLSQPHGVGFVWCTMLWDLTWALIGQYGFDPDIYNGTGGNNIAMQLVVDGLKLTPCSPGFVDGRDAILAADLQNNGGANQNLIWAVFAGRGLGASASQGSSNSRTDQAEAYDTPLPTNVGMASITSPGGDVFDCTPSSIPVTVVIRNYGQVAQSNFDVRYQVDGGAFVTETFTGILATGTSASFTFAQPALISGIGQHTIAVSTALVDDQFVANDQASRTFGLVAASTINAPFAENVEGGSVTPTGWTLQNPDNSTTWTTALLANGPACASSRSWSIDYYGYNAPGQEDRLLTPKVDLSASAGTRLKFHHAYAPYAAGYDDGLRVDVSVSCGASWTTVFQQVGSVLATTANSSSAWTPTNCNQWRLNDIDLSAYDGQTVLIRFSGINGYGNYIYLDNVVLESNGVALSVKLLLEGNYDSGTDRMRDSLRTNALLPPIEPYSALGFTQAGNGGGETADASVFTTTGDNAIVDWVLLELRSATTPTTIVATRCALLQRDGDVVDKDGLSPVVFLAGPGNYHVAARHRNHFGSMTATPIALIGTPTSLDLTSSSTATYGTEARKSSNGREMLWAGDVTTDGTIKYTGTGNDRDLILQAIGGSVATNTVNGYLRSDVNLDGTVKYTGTGNDRDVILVNIGGTVATNTREEQLP